MQLKTTCDSVLYAYLSKVADTTEKRHYLHVSCTAVMVNGFRLGFSDLNTFLDFLHKFDVFDLHHSVQPYDLRDLLATMSLLSHLSYYFRQFRSDPERSREFHYEDGLWHTFVATRYMRFLRKLSDSR
jgi:hypothetical protein